MLDCIIIDDEQQCIDGLRAMLEQRLQKKVRIQAHTTNPLDAAQLIHQFKPDIVFLDVEMPRLNGIDMLKMIPDRNFEVVFTTAWEKYAVEAIKNSAADYLVKPFSLDELTTAVLKCEERIEINLRIGKASIKPRPDLPPQRFAITAQNGSLLIVNPSEIVWIRAESNYSTVFFTDRPKLLVAKTLREFDEQLSVHNFFRIHSGSLVNMTHVKSFHSGGGEEYVTMSTGDKVELARRRKPEFFELIKKI
jgi:two-component system LytT family response regulator